MSSKKTLFFLVFATVLFCVLITTSVITFIIPETFASKSTVHFDEKHITESLEHFLIPERDIFRSEYFRNLLVDNLLAKNWSRKPDYIPPLSRADFSQLVEKSFKATANPNVPVIEIEAFASNPQDAAALANAIAETYRLYRLETAKKVRAESVRAKEDSFHDVLQKIEACRKKLSELDPAKTEEQFSEVLNRKLEAAPAEESSSREPEHFIVKPAVPNLRPVRPNKALNLAIGAMLGTVLGSVAGLVAITVRKPKL